MKTRASFMIEGLTAEVEREKQHMTDDRFASICWLILAAIIGAVCIAALVVIGWPALVAEAVLAFIVMALKYCE